MATIALVGAVLGTAQGSTLFLDEWGVSYGNWTPNYKAPVQTNLVIEDWVSGGNGYVGPGYGGQDYDAEAAYIAFD